MLSEHFMAFPKWHQIQPTPIQYTGSDTVLHLKQCFLHFSSTITTVWIALWKRVWNKPCLEYWSKFNCHHSFVSFLYTQHYITVQSVRSEHKTTEVMICTYWWWLSVNGEHETEQGRRLEPVRSALCAVSRKTQKCLIKRHRVKKYGQDYRGVQGH